MVQHGPCVQAAPCGESGIPTTPASVPVDRVALWGLSWVLPAATATRFVWASTLMIAPGPRADRLDDPPERLIVG